MADEISKGRAANGTTQRKCHAKSERNPKTQMGDQDHRQNNGEEAEVEAEEEATTKDLPQKGAKARTEVETDHRTVGEALNKVTGATRVAEATNPSDPIKEKLRSKRTQTSRSHSHLQDTYMPLRQVDLPANTT